MHHGNLSERGGLLTMQHELFCLYDIGFDMHVLRYWICSEWNVVSLQERDLFNWDDMLCL